MQSVKNVLICILIAGVCIFGLISFQNMCVELFSIWGLETPAVGTGLFDSGFWWPFVLAGILPPIYEELIFRFGVCKLLKWAKLKEIWIIIISAALFMLWHQSFSQAVYQFIMGVIFAVIYLKTNNILWTMLIHFINNAFILIYTFFTYKYLGVADTQFMLSFGNIAIAVVLGVISVLIVRDLIKELPYGRKR